MIMRKTTFTRMRRDLNSMIRKLTIGEVDTYVVILTEKEKFALVGLPAVERWYKQLELLAELVQPTVLRKVPAEEETPDSDQEDVS